MEGLLSLLPAIGFSIVCQRTMFSSFAISYISHIFKNNVFRFFNFGMLFVGITYTSISKILQISIMVPIKKVEQECESFFVQSLLGKRSCRSFGLVGSLLLFLSFSFLFVSVLVFQQCGSFQLHPGNFSCDYVRLKCW